MSMGQLINVSCLMAALFLSASASAAVEVSPTVSVLSATAKSPVPPKSPTTPAPYTVAPEALLSVEAILRRAAVSVREKTYKGRFTYEFGSVLETLELVHVVEGGIERERILHLSGQKREFLMTGHRSDCVSVGSFLLRGGSLSRNGTLQKLDQNYHFYIGADERVAGRDAAMVQVVPKDEYRYGMTMAFDKSSGLPLRSLTGTKNSTIERFQFVSLVEGDAVTEADLEPTLGPHTTLDSGDVTCTSLKLDAPSTGVSWAAGWVPPGFVLSQGGREQGYDEVLTYSDGLTSFSLFISALDAAAVAGFKGGLARRGATLVMMSRIEINTQAYAVMLVGEVPLITAKKVFSSVTRI